VAKGGGAVVLPWREEIRYGPRKAGYHGGAAPAEAVIPLLIFSAGDENAVPGWAGAPVASPTWWREPAGAEAGAPVPAAPAARRPRPQQADRLFDLPTPGAGATAPAAPGAPGARPPAAGPPALVGALLASDVYRQRRGTRAPLPDARVAALLGALLGGGGRATLDSLAVQAGIPVHRIGGTVTALRRLLQVEGYPVLVLDPDGQTVKLDVALLVEQFGLGPA
jgi:hypothetical protein